MPNEKTAKIYDLEERTAEFGEDIIALVGKAPKTAITIPILNQLIRAGTSIGANYCEADCAESKKDFEHKLGICKKEAKETRFWLRMVKGVAPELTRETQKLWQEAHELQLIFIAIVKKSRLNKNEAVR